MKKITISIVVIGRNGSKFLNKSLDSITNINDADIKQIIYVDSASTDNSVDIVEKYAIRIVSLPQTNVLTPSAGRYIGYLIAKTSHILFIDCDMTLNSKWLQVAKSKLAEDKTIGVITGNATELRNDTKHKLYDDIGYVDSVYGSFLIDRNLIKKYDLINPYLEGGEEKYLSMILLNNGYRIFRTKEENIVHLGYEKSATSKIKRARYLRGNIQRIKLLPTNLKKQALIDMKTRLLIIPYILLSIFGIIMLPALYFSSNITFALIVTVFIVFLPIIMLLRKPSILTLQSYCIYYVELYNLLMAFILPVPNSKEYPNNYVIIQ